MVLSALQLHPLGPNSSRPHPGALRVAETGPAASLVGDFFGEATLSAPQRRFLLDHLCIPKGAEIFLGDGTCRERLTATLSHRRSEAVPIRVGAVVAQVESLEDGLRDLYISFLGALVEALTPVQAMVLSLMYGIGAFHAASAAIQSIDDRCLNTQETARVLLISHQRVSQIEADIANRVRNILNGKSCRTYYPPKKVSLDFSSELSTDAQESDLKERLRYLQERISGSAYKKVEAAVYFVLSRDSNAVFKLLMKSTCSLTCYSLVRKSIDKGADLPPELLMFCERISVRNEVSRKSINRQKLMNLYVTLLNMACFEVSKYDDFKYTLRAIEKLQDLVGAQ